MCREGTQAAFRSCLCVLEWLCQWFTNLRWARVQGLLSRVMSLWPSPEDHNTSRAEWGTLISRILTCHCISCLILTWTRNMPCVISVKVYANIYEDILFKFWNWNLIRPCFGSIIHLCYFRALTSLNLSFIMLKM